MKSTALTPKCMSAVRSGLRRRTRHAHTRAQAASGAGSLGPAPSLSYTERPALPEQPVFAGPTRPRVLHVDADAAASSQLASLMAPDADVVHAPTLAAARHLMSTGVFSLVVLDPALPDGDPRSLFPMLSGTPLLVYSALQPEWRGMAPEFLSKPWTSARQLWSTMSTMLGVSAGASAGA